MGGAFGLLYPLALFLGVPLLLAMIYAYLRKKKLPVITIPSLFLLRDLSSPISTRRRFVPPPRFWIELFLLAVLLLCLAGLFTHKESARYAIIFDNSLSLAAQRDGETLISLQRADVKKTVAALPAESLFDLYRTSPQLERIGGKDISRDSVVERVDELVPVFARDSISEVVGLVAQREIYSGLIVFTDRPLRSAGEGSDSLAGVSIHRTKIEDLHNIALVDPVQKGDEIQFTIKGYGTRRAAEGRVVLEALSQDGVWQIRQQKAFTLGDGSGESLAFKIPAGKEELLRVSLLEPKAGSFFNALAEDDQLYFSNQRMQPGVQVFSLRSLRDLGIEKIRGIRFSQAKIEDYDTVRAAHPSDTFLFVDYVPQGLPDRASIVVSPPQSSGGFEIGEVISQAEVSEWNAGHPLLTYIDVSTLKLSRFIPITPPIWGASVVSSVRGSVLVAGERAGNRQVIVGFDLFPYRGRGTPTQSVLFLNMLRWVSDGRATSSSSAPYQALLMSPHESTVEELGRAPDAQSIRVAAGSRFVPDHPGIYKLRGSQGIAQTIVVNFVDSQEFQLSIAEPELLTSSDSSVQVGAKVETRRLLTEVAIPLVIAFLCLDLLLSLVSPLNLVRANLRKKGAAR